MVKYWGVRLGEGGKYFQSGYAGKFIAIGWKELGTLNWLLQNEPEDTLLEKLKEKYKVAYSGNSEPPASKVGIESGEIFRFVRHFEVGDIILVPNPPERKVAIGRIKGAYEYREDWKDNCQYLNRRRVEWIKTISRDELSVPLKNSLVWLTIVSLESHKGEINGLMSGTKPVSHLIEKETTGDELYEKVIAKLKELEPKAFEEFIAHLLEKMGFEASTRKYVGDGGIDVDGVLGTDLGSMTVRIQVKRVSSTLGNTTVLQLRGSLGSRDFGAIITTNKFTKQAIQEAEAKDKTPITLIEGTDLVDIILTHYDKLDEQYQDLLSLKKKDIPLVDQFTMGSRK